MIGEEADARLLASVTGKDALGFLQGLVTNDVLPLGRAPGLVWTGFLSPQGKYLADFFVVNTAETLLLDLPLLMAEDVLKRLGMYRLRADVQLTPQPGLHVTCGLGTAPDAGFADPRHPALGWRHYGTAKGGPMRIDWQDLRVKHLIPEANLELIPNESYILEWGFERLHGVDFRKGCYVGQEVTARMKHKTELRKGIARIAVSRMVGIGAEITADGKAVGQVFTQSGGEAIAHLRFDRVTDDMMAGDAEVRFLGTA
ncbi:folate-binding protein [Pseudorhodobacter sp. E13]|uniref:CAF17-like 4Fe-4S cluster assembly/insertion protein YgfZ n=1 Tax=Pseudorhodobacter sp. E13 TaxID=2487931 RepID=UPI000F8F6BD2|nr:folate-binding protein YgfZ [Pseudorhodobacter sp. E13]RUS59172.1 folate-binding protein [Pseudorhodobacter sp. E13]